MKIGVMQPYFFPYIGYWQLIKAVDIYVVYDDVNYINRGWINRNRILLDGKVRYFNLPLLGASQNKLIKDIRVNQNEKEISRNISIIQQAYGKAPYYNQIQPLIESILRCGCDRVSEYNAELLKKICDYLEIKTEIILSSQIEKDNSLKGQDKILRICKTLGADEYYNAIGGQSLYSYEKFRDNNIALKFLRTNSIIYKQFDDEFEANLSIIDMLMFNSASKVKEFLKCYELIGENQNEI